jgi:hypothetical protein
MESIPLGLVSVHDEKDSSHQASSESPSNQAPGLNFITFCASSSTSRPFSGTSSGLTSTESPFFLKCSICNKPRPFNTTCSLPFRKSTIFSGSKDTTTSMSFLRPYEARASFLPTVHLISRLVSGASIKAQDAASSYRFLSPSTSSIRTRTTPSLCIRSSSPNLILG